MISSHGIYYDLNHSPYKVESEDFIFVFSSKLHEAKFKKRKEENRNKINQSLSKRFNFDIKLCTLADIVLYTKIETRGFLIVTKDGFKVCQKSNLTFDGDKKTLTY